MNQQTQWINKPSLAWAWAMQWVEESKNGRHTPIKRIHEAAKNIKDTYCTDGLWSPGADVVYLMLREAADMAQSEYEASIEPSQAEY